MTSDERRQLDEQGCLLLPGLMPPELLARLRNRIDELFALEGASAGSEFKQEPEARRLANLVDKGEVFEEVILTPRVLECMAHLLGPRFKLSSLNARSTDPHSAMGQPLHADSGAIADRAGILRGELGLAARRLHRRERRHPLRSRLAHLAPAAGIGITTSRIPRSNWCSARRAT